MPKEPLLLKRVLQSLYRCYRISIGLYLMLWVSISYADQQQMEKHVIGSVEIKLMRSEMHYSGVTYKNRDGLDIKISVPRITKAMAAYYNPNLDFEYIDDVESEIGAAVIAKNKLWFGLSFYGGEGTSGIGGVGFIDPAFNKIGILRHPALVNCSAKAIQVTPEEIVVLTYFQGELAGGLCNGLVRINRKTLDSIIQVPKGNVQAIWDKDEGLTSEEKLVANQYEAAKVDLIGHFKDWPIKAGPSLLARDQALQNSIGLEQLMEKVASQEYRWFAQAVDEGELVFDQRCKWDAGEKQPSCIPEFKIGKKCNDWGECVHMDMFKSMIFYGTATHYRCFPSAWISFGVPTDKKYYGMGNSWMTEPLNTPGRNKEVKFDSNGKQESQEVEMLKLGYFSTFYSQGTQSKFSVEVIETVNITCGEPFSYLTGLAMSSLSTRMQTRRINQTYILPELRNAIK